MRDELPPWADEGAEEPRRRGGGRAWLFALAVAPWLVIVGMLVTGTISAGGPDADGDPSGSAHPHAPHPAVPGPGGSPDPGAPAQEDDHPEHGGAPEPGDRPAGPHDTDARDTHPNGDTAPGRGPRPEGSAADVGHARDVEAAGAVARLVARAWLTDVGPRLAVEGLAPRSDLYLEDSAVETVELAGDHAVVTLLTVVLERDGDHYATATPRRLAVPVQLGARPRPAGEPWWLEDPDLRPVDPELTPQPDPDLLLTLGEALTEAADEASEVVEAGRTGDGWWVVTATTPDEDRPQHVWLPPDVLGNDGGPDGPGVAHESEGPPRGADDDSESP